MDYIYFTACILFVEAQCYAKVINSMHMLALHIDYFILPLVKDRNTSMESL